MEQVIEREIITMCIKHADLEVKELSELLYIINLSINDYYRDNGIAGGQLSHYAPTIKAVRQGSIILDIVFALLRETSVTAAAEVLAGYLKKRIALLRERYENGRANRQIFNYEITTRIEIRIENGRIVIEVNQ